MNKKTIVCLAISIMMTGSILTLSAQTPNKKVSHARAELKDAKQDLADAKKDSAREYQKFKMDADNIISYNETKIVALKAKRANAKKEINDKYNERVATLEKSNSELKVRVNNYKADGNIKWMLFKTQFHQEVKRLNKEFQDSRDK